MDIKNILSKVDHTLLSQSATNVEILSLLEDGMEFGAASCCIPPNYISMAKRHVEAKGDKLALCTVIGFPNGYSSTATKIFETGEAIINGADEIDMVVNIAEIKNGDYGYVLNEIEQIKKICGNRVLKVIVETCLLSEEEKINMCEIVTRGGADFIKTSTGFSTGGATFDDIALFKKHVGPNVKIKASGGISSFDDAVKFIELGADRLGTSRLIKLAKEMPEFKR